MRPGSSDAAYELVRHLATGGMAELYVARRRGEPADGRHVVLKRILTEHARNPQFVSMFLDEARLASRLNHPNIARVIDVGRTGATYYYTMEYVHGENARDLLQSAAKRRVRIPVEATVTVIAAAGAGLHAAHEQRDRHGRPLEVVHRDVSPSNVMIGYDGVAKVVDFGVAKAADRMTETRSGTVKGKIAYLSPEQCLFRDLDRRSDVFSLGIVAWEMLTQRRLFKRASDYETMRAIIEEELLPPSAAERHVPAELDRVILRAMARDPDERYPTAAAFAGELEEAARRSGLALGPAPVARVLEDLFGAPRLPWIESTGDTTDVLALHDIEVIDVSAIEVQPGLVPEAIAVAGAVVIAEPVAESVSGSEAVSVSGSEAVSVSGSEAVSVSEPVSVSGSEPVTEPVPLAEPVTTPVPLAEPVTMPMARVESEPVAVPGFDSVRVASPVSVSVPGVWITPPPPPPRRRVIQIATIAASAAIAIAIAATIATSGSHDRVDAPAELAAADRPVADDAVPVDAAPIAADRVPDPPAPITTTAARGAADPVTTTAARGAAEPTTPAAAPRRDEARDEAVARATASAKRARWAEAAALCSAGLDRWPRELELVTVCAKASCALGKKTLAHHYLDRLPARRRAAIEQLCLARGTFHSSTECTDDPTACR